MLFISTSFMSPLPHCISFSGTLASWVLKRICSMGMMAMKENMFNIAERMLNTTVSARYFL